VEVGIWREVNEVEMCSRNDFPPSGTVKSPSRFGKLSFLSQEKKRERVKCL